MTGLVLVYLFNGISTLLGYLIPKFVNDYNHDYIFNVSLHFFLFVYNRLFVQSYISTCQGLFYAERLGNHVHHMFLVTFFVQLFLRGCLHTVISYQVFLSNTNNLHTIIWYQVFLSNTNNSYTIIWYQVVIPI